MNSMIHQRKIKHSFRNGGDILLIKITIFFIGTLFGGTIGALVMAICNSSGDDDKE